MEPFRSHSGNIAVYDADNVDTDRIIPARFLSRVSRSGYGDLLFKDVRADGHPLDAPEAVGASVLVVGTNFGCGSSREHAVWAIQQAGFKVVVARATETSPGYSDIFRQNSANCGLLLIELPEHDHRRFVDAGSGAPATIDLEAQTARVGASSVGFHVNPVTRQALLEGLDLIGTTMVFEPQIREHEDTAEIFVPEK